MADPYTPSVLQGQSISQRGAISFVTTAPENQRSDDDALPTETQNDNYAITPISSRSSLGQRSPTSGYKDGLPLLSIPAPSRRPKSDDE